MRQVFVMLNLLQSRRDGPSQCVTMSGAQAIQYRLMRSSEAGFVISFYFQNPQER